MDHGTQQLGTQTPTAAQNPMDYALRPDSEALAAVRKGMQVDNLFTLWKLGQYKAHQVMDMLNMMSSGRKLRI